MEPMGNLETTFMLATLCSLLVNSLRAIFSGKNSKGKPVSPKDFIPHWTGEDTSESIEEQSVEEMKRMLQQIASSPSSTQPKTKKRRPVL